MPRYAKMIYNGFWWSPERLALQELINYSQKTVSGDITLKLFKGNIIVMSRSSKKSYMTRISRLLRMTVVFLIKKTLRVL